MRSRFILFLLFGISGLKAQNAAFATVSAASYQPMVAPDSLASIFGSGLAVSTATAQLDSNGQLPQGLAGTSVQVNGKSAALLYVSPQQINFLVPEDTAIGTANLIIRTSGNPGGFTGTVQVSNTAAGIFTGAIVNAVTNAPPPFLVETPENGGPDKRTRLAVYGSGIRKAGKVAAEGRDTSGNVFTLAVEFAGKAPGYFGLDQVNLVLPPEIDGAGDVSLAIAADDVVSNAVTFRMNRLPVTAIRLVNFGITPNAVGAGDDASGTLSLNAPAPTGGYLVRLETTSPSVQAPSSIVIQQGRVTAQFGITTSTAGSVQPVTLTARSASGTLAATLEIDPANTIQLQAFTLNPGDIQAGTPVSATAALSANATSTATVALASDNAAVKPPDTISIPAGQKSATITIPTDVVAEAQNPPSRPHSAELHWTPVSR